MTVNVQCVCLNIEIASYPQGELDLLGWIGWKKMHIYLLFMYTQNAVKCWGL
jgi:hypothetical protein